MMSVIIGRVLLFKKIILKIIQRPFVNAQFHSRGNQFVRGFERWTVLFHSKRPNHSLPNNFLSFCDTNKNGGA